MTATDTAPTARSQQWGLAAVSAVGVVVAAVLAGYAHAHPGDGATITTFGFSALLPMKAWLTTAATALVIVQVLTAASMWGRLGRSTPTWAAPVHRWSGTVAFVITMPVVFHCVWSLGFATDSPRTVIHSLTGCLFYGVFAAKMLSLRLRGLPGWTLPVLGGLLAVLLVVLWFTAALWYFTQSGASLT
jgi:hypothetical protein